MNSKQKASRPVSTLILAALLTYIGAAPAAGQLSFDSPREVPNRGWISLSNTPGRTSDLSDLAAAGSDVYLVWRDSAPNGGRSQEIRFRASADGGASFGDAPSGRVLAIIPPHQSVFSVRAAAHGSSVYVLFAGGLTPSLAQVSLIRSNDRGATFSEAVNIEAGEGSSPYPDLTIDDSGILHLVFEDRGATSDILHMTSADGITFSAAAAVANTEDPSFLPRVSAKGTNVAVVWHDVVGTARSKPGQGEIFLARSSDSGTTFSAPVNLSATQEDSVSAAVAWAESLHLVWVEGQDVVYRRSSDGGHSFTEPVSIGSAAEGERIRDPRVFASERWVRSAWLREEPTGNLRGPFVQHARDGLPFGQAQDLTLDLPGSAFGAAAIAGAAGGMVAWPHTGSGLEADSEILVIKANAVVCTISWSNPAGGLWTTAGNWDAVPARVPGPTDHVCITVDGTYTVTLRGNQSVASVTLGAAANLGRQTLLIDTQSTGVGVATLTVGSGIENAGTIVLDSNSSGVLWNANLVVTTGNLNNSSTGVIHVRETVAGASPRLIDANVVNDGTVNIEQSTVLGKHFINRNQVTIQATEVLSFGTNTGTFSQTLGTLAVNGAFQLNADTFNFNGGTINGNVEIRNGSALNIAPGASTAGFIVHQGGNRISGDVGAATTILIEGLGGDGSAVLTAETGFSNAGTIILDSNSAGELWDASLIVTTGTLTNTGLIHIRESVAGLSDRLLNADVMNEGTVTVEQDLVLEKHFTNKSIFTVQATEIVTFGANDTFTQEAGTLTVAATATFQLNVDTFNFNGGTINGNVELHDTSGLAQGSALNIGPGATSTAGFVFHQRNNSISGDIGPGTTILIEGLGNGGPATLIASESFKNTGTIILDSLSGGDAWDASLIITGGTLTNTSTGVIRTRETDPPDSDRFITGDVVNEGSIFIDKSVTLSGHVTNKNVFSVATGAKVDFGTNAIFTQEAGTLTIAGTGSFVLNADTFNFNGGTINGIVELNNNQALANGSALNIGPGATGTAGFLVHQINNLISGNIAPGTTILIEGVGNGGAGMLKANASFENAGTIILDSKSGGDAWDASLIVASGTLTNTATGVIRSRETVPPDSDRFITGNLINEGSVFIDKSTTLSGQFTNKNVFSIATGRIVDFGLNAIFTQEAGALTIAGTGSFVMSGDTFNFNGGTVSPGVHLWTGTALHIGPSSTGAAIFTFHQVGNKIFGDIAQNQTILIQGLGGPGPAAVTAETGFTNHGTIILDSDSAGAGWDATFNVTAGTLTNSATGRIHSRVSVPGLSARVISASILNLGTMDIDKTTSFTKAGATYTNSNTYDIAPGAILKVTGTGGTFLNPAPGSIAGGGTLELAINTTFRGVGNIAAHVSNNGQFHPGGSPGVLNITGNFSQLNSGTLHIELGGSALGEFDRLNISGTATLNGTLRAGLFGGYCPEGSFTIMTYASRSGDFVTKVLNVGGGRTMLAQPGATSYVLATSGPPCNTAPIANNDTYSTSAGVALNVPAADGVLDNDTDAEGDTLSAILVTGPSSGTLVLNSNGSFTYTPSTNNVGVDSFTYKANDGTVDSDVATVTINLVDDTPPVTTATTTPDPNVNGWFKTDVMVHLNATDGAGGSGVDEIRYQINGGPVTVVDGAVASFNLTAEQVYTISYFAIDGAGEAESPKTLIVRIDKTAPNAISNRSPLANAHGWNKGDVAVHFEASDALSGIPGESVIDVILSDEGENQAESHTFTDRADNPITVTVDGINIDKTPPQVQTSLSPEPNVNGWNKTDVMVHFAATDPLSGVVENTFDVLATMEAANQEFIHTFTDRADNETTATVIVNIDKTAPTVDAQRNPVPNDQGWNNTDVTVHYQASDALSGLDGSSSFDDVLSSEGANQSASHSFFDKAGNEGSASVQGINIDKTAPSIEAPANVNDSTGPAADSCVKTINDLGTATTTDNLTDVTVTVSGVPEGHLFPVGTSFVTYTATDEAGNVNSDTQTVTVTDDTPPTVSAPANLTRSTGPEATSCGVMISDADLGSATAQDNCPGASVNRTGVPAGNFFPVGTTIITYTATDATGNDRTATQEITVLDSTPPAVQAPADITRDTGQDSTSCALFISDEDLGTSTATDACSGVVVTRSNMPAGNMFAVGTTIITYTATDEAGNTSTDTQLVTVLDDTDPTITAPADLSRSTGAGANSCGMTITDAELGSASANDNCSGVTVTRSPAGNLFPVGSTTITYTATDGSGNTSTDTQVVTVVDDTDPSLSCPANITVDAAAGSCSANVNPGTPTATDNCSVNVSGTRSDSQALNASYPVGTTTIHWIAEDASGNQTSCDQTITVRDSQAPVITNASASPSVLAPADGRMVDVAISYNLADNCGAAVGVLSVASSDPDTGEPDWQVLNANSVRLRAEVAAGAAERRYTITITATDPHGNTSSANVIVIVSGAVAVTPLILLEQIEDELERLINRHRGKKGVNHLEKALKDVRKAIETLRQQPQNRGCAANAIKNAVQAIEQAVKANVISSADAFPLLQALTQASRMLAAEAMADAIAAGREGEAIQTAQRMMADGDAAASSGDYRRAVQEYKTTINVLEGGGCGGGDDE